LRPAFLCYIFILGLGERGFHLSSSSEINFSQKVFLTTKEGLAPPPDGLHGVEQCSLLGEVLKEQGREKVGVKIGKESVHSSK
jgi:hypothetical protein